MKNLVVLAKKSFCYFMFVPFIFLFLSSSALSQYEEEEFFTAGDWVETAAKRAQPIEQSPAAVSVITSDEIRCSGATNLAELLRRVPGMDVMMLLPSNYEVGARGQNRPMANGVLVLIDGRSAYQDSMGFVLWSQMDFPLEQVEKIEVVRGPGSVLYGANAFHAVVNIITRKPGNSADNLISLTAGPETVIGTVMESGTTGKVRHILSTGWTQYSGFSDTEEPVSQYPRGRISLHYDLEEKGTLKLAAGFLAGDYVSFFDMFGKMQSFSQEYNVSFQYDRPNFYFRLYWNEMDAPQYEVLDLVFDDYDIALPIEVSEDFDFEAGMENHTVDGEAQQILELSGSNRLTLGANVRYSTLNSGMVSEYKTQGLFAGYLQHEFWWSNLVRTYLGARYDYNPITEHNLSPRGSVLVSPLSGHTLRLSVGRSFRNPTMMEAYGDIAVDTEAVDIYFRGNDGLDPEVLTSFEGGYVASLLKGKVQGSASLFLNLVEGLIFPYFEEGIINFPIEGTYENILDETARGLEIEVKARPYPWISGFANYSFVSVEIDRFRLNERDEMQDVEEIVTEFEARGLPFDTVDERTPRHKVNGGITAMLENGLSATVLIHYVGETKWPANMDREVNIGEEDPGLFPIGRTDAYTLVNLQAAYRFLDGRAETAVNVFNLLGDEHPEYPLTEDVGRRFTGTVRFRF